MNFSSDTQMAYIHKQGVHKLRQRTFEPLLKKLTHEI